MSPNGVNPSENCPLPAGASGTATFLKRGYYFCLVQSRPVYSSFVFTGPGDYLIGCSCASTASSSLVTLPLGTSPQSRGNCGHRGSCSFLGVKVQEKRISFWQSPKPIASSDGSTQSVGYHFVKDTENRRSDVFTQVESPEKCTFRMLPASGVSGNSVEAVETSVCSFSVRRVLLGYYELIPPILKQDALPACATNRREISFFTEYENSISTRCELLLDSKLGKGGNGEVFLGIDRSCGQAVAVKREPKDMLRHEFSLITEIRVNGTLLMYKTRDPHPSKFLAVLVHSVAVEVGNSAVAAALAHHSAVHDRHDHMVLELVNGGELRKLLKAKYPCGMPLEMARAYIYQIVCGLVLIHSKQVIHRDLKTQNILVRHGATFLNDELKIIDFGNSVKVKPESVFTKNYTTCFACAPEQFQLPKSGYSYGIDIWALGTIFYELLTGERLFECLNMMEASWQIPAFKARTVTERLPLLPEDAKAFLLSCLSKDPQQRPTAVQLLTTPFLFPLHTYQIRRRVETTGVYDAYMTAFQKGWGNLKPSETLVLPEGLIYDKAGGAFIEEGANSETVDVVLPVFQCVPDFRSQGHGVSIQNWILASDASFHFSPMQATGLKSATPSPHSDQEAQPSSKDSADSNASTQPPDEEESNLSPGDNKLFPREDLFHPNSTNLKGALVAPKWSLGRFTSSMGSSPCVPLVLRNENLLALTKRTVHDSYG